MPLGPPEDPDRFEDPAACVDALSEDMSEEEARRVCGAWEDRAKAGKSHRSDGTLERRVEFKATDADRRVAIGGVMVPDKVDLQGDFAETALIEQFSDSFMELLQDGDGTPGVMHSVFPTSHVTLAENRILDEAREIGGKEFPAGSWIQGWKFTDDELWSLVEDGILSAYSIGARNVEWSEPMEEAPDGIERAADYPEDEPVWQLLDGEVHEVSSVDIPAVPDAQMVAAKSDSKAILDHVEGKNQFLDVMSDRGASEDDAERLWHYLQRAIDEHGEGKSAGFFRRLGKGAWEALTGDVSQEKQKSGDTKQFMGEPVDELSDAVESALDGLTDVAFDAIFDEVSENHPDEVAEAVAGVAGAIVGEETDDLVDEITQELRDSNRTLQMSDNDNPDDNPPEWAKSIQEATEENSKAIKELREELKEGSDDPWEDAPEWAKSLKESTEQNADAIENLAEASGKSQQLDGEGDDDSSAERSKADILGLAGGGD